MNLEQMIQRQQELLNTAKAEQRELTAEEQTEFDSLQRSIDSIRNTEAARAAETSRCAEITSLCRDFDMDAQDYIRNGNTVEEVRAAIIERMKKNHAPLDQPGSADTVTVTASEEDKFRAAAADALLVRGDVITANAAPGARELASMSLRDLFIETMERSGESGLHRKSSDDLFAMAQRQFFNPTAAFPAILDNAVQKAYVEGHKTAPVTFDRFTKKGSLKDFKTADNNYLAGPAQEFLEVPEGGELKHSTFEDKHRPTRKLKTYGRQFTLTRQAFINDDIGLVTSVPAKYAAAARKTINKQVYDILLKNPAIYDGTALFSAGHKNVLSTGTGITQAALQKMILALQNQKDEFGEAAIINPAKLVLPVGLGFDMFTLFNSPTINSAGNTQAANPLFKFASSVDIIEDPTINAFAGNNPAPWFLLGAASDTDFIEVDYLNGNEIPTIRRSEVPGTLGFVWDIYLDWGISVMDFRGAIKNPGVAIEDPLA